MSTRRLRTICLATITAVITAVATSFSLGAQAPPSTDIYLAPLKMKDGKPVVGAPINITSRVGYDNQPSFTPDNKSILFTSTRDDGQSDIYRYDLASKAVSRVTSTPESEYSATVMPGGKRFSVIRVEKDSAQRLWSFAMDGSDPRLVLTALRPVGYHAWLDANNLALFVLGRPNALVHADARTDKSDTLARNIGRSLLPLPGKKGFSYIRIADSSSMLVTMTWPGQVSRDLVAMPRRAQDIAWAAPDVALVGSGTKLMYWKAGASGWSDVADFAGGLSDLTRMAVSPDGKWIAIVAADRKP